MRNVAKVKDRGKRDVVEDYLNIIFKKYKSQVPIKFYEKLLKLLTYEITGLTPSEMPEADVDIRTEQHIHERINSIIEKPDDFLKKIAQELILDDIADITYGFVGADLAALAREAAMNALRRYLPEIDLEKPIPIELLEKMDVTLDDFKNAHRGIEPSALREFLVEVPKITWDEVGGLEIVKQNLKEAVEWPLTQPEVFKRLGIDAPRGILLYGPPGTGKTLLAKAVAHESKANFISIKGPEVLSKWVGESEKAVRELFKKARQVAPTIVFLDEIDAIAPRRGAYSGSHVTESVVNQLLTSIDGLESMEGVVIIGATNRPDIIDPGLLRPGRFDRLMLIPSPNYNSRFEIFKIHTKGMPITVSKQDVAVIEGDIHKSAEILTSLKRHQQDLKKITENEKLLYWLAGKTEGYSGADIEALCREAAMLALRKDINADVVSKPNFEEAMSTVRASITEEVMNYYKGIAESLSAAVAKKDKKDRDIQYM
jgi:transitional endoplasmic reticulum ATPase